MTWMSRAHPRPRHTRSMPSWLRGGIGPAAPAQVAAQMADEVGSPRTICIVSCRPGAPTLMRSPQQLALRPPQDQSSTRRAVEIAAACLLEVQARHLQPVKSTENLQLAVQLGSALAFQAMRRRLSQPTAHSRQNPQIRPYWPEPEACNQTPCLNQVTTSTLFPPLLVQISSKQQQPLRQPAWCV